MDDCVGQMRKLDGSLQKPVAYLTCNFNRPVNGKPALFTHDEVITLFHEFGHGLHHMLTRIDTAGVSGISGCRGMRSSCRASLWRTGAGSRKRWRLSPAIMKPENRCRRSCWRKCWRRKLPGGDVYSAPAGVRPVRFPPACGVQTGAGAKILETSPRLKAGRRGAGADTGPLPARLQPHLRWRLCGRLLQLPVGRRAGGRRLLTLRRRGIFNRETGQSFLDNILSAAVPKSRWSCSNASAGVSRSWTRCWSITGSKADCYVKICLIDETGAGDGALSVLAARWGWSRMTVTRWRWC